MDLTFRKEGHAARALSLVTGIFAFALFTYAGAFVRIPLPFTPVPLTLQTFCVLLSGAFLGGVAGPLSQMVYLALGAAGFSVFAGTGAGALYLCGPTGGYIAGFVLASLVCGLSLGRVRGFAGTLAVFLLGSAVILVCGSAWLRFVTGIPVSAAIAQGMLPFVPGDMVKSVAAALILQRCRK